MNLSANTSIPIITVFIQGMISFFSPCVLPLIPVYMGYLSGGTLTKGEDGVMHYNKRKVMINTLFFTIGVSFAFFALGFGMSAIGRFFSQYQIMFARIGGIIVVLFGLYQLGIFGASKLLNTELRLPFQVEKMTMSPFTALLFGFVLSFAWSPCIGPVLSSVLIMAASANTANIGFLMIAVYTLGYVVPFLLVGLFTTQLLEFFGKHRSIVKYTVKIGGAILVIMGLLMFTGKMNGITSYLSTVSNSVEEDTAVSDDVEDEIVEDEVVSDEAAEEEATDLIPAADFTLVDQYGNTHSLSDYRGKIVFLNFWATWCPPCKAELPYIQELYEENLADEDSDIVFLTMTFPGYGSEQDVDGVKAFIEENGYTFPVLMADDYSIISNYYITAYPTTFLIDPNGDVLGYVPGGMTKDIMEDVISQAREASQK